MNKNIAVFLFDYRRLARVIDFIASAISAQNAQKVVCRLNGAPVRRK